MKKLSKFSLILVIFSLILVGCTKKEPVEKVIETSEKQVMVQEIKLQDEVVSKLTVSGTIVPKQYSIIRSLTQGTLEYVAPVGSQVVSGQSLFNINDNSIESNYFNSLQSFKQTNILADEKVVQAELSVNSAQAQYNLALSNLEISKKQANQAIFNARESAKSAYKSAYNQLSQFFDFIAVGDPLNFNFIYKDIETPKYQMKIDTREQYVKTAMLFSPLPSEADPENLENSLKEMDEMLTEAKILVNQIFLLINDSRIPNYDSFAGDRTVINGHQAQINLFKDSILGSQNGLVNTEISNNLNIDKMQNALDVAEIQLNNSKIGLSNSQTSSELEKTISQTQLDNAAYNFSNLSLPSPFTGTVLSQLAQPGQQVSVGKEIVELGNLSIVEISVEIDSEFAKGLKVGDLVVINEDISGFISEIEPAGNIRSGKIGVTVQSDNKDEQLFTSEVADIHFSLNYKESGLVIVPIKSVTIESSGAYVFVVEDGKAVRRDVVLGRIFNDKVSVVEGLNEGDKMVLKNGVFVSEGDEVEINN